jgi:hypothetical protein
MREASDTMSARDRFDVPEAAGAAQFATTRWSLVAAAQGGSAEAQEALATLCQAYWYPLYAYARRGLPSLHDAQDLTQAFFAELLEKDYLHAHPDGLVAVAGCRRTSRNRPQSP